MPFLSHLFVYFHEANTVHVWHSRTPVGVLCAHFLNVITKIIDDSATWYSTHTCLTLLRYNSENGVFIIFFYFSLGQYMCGAPESLTAFGARTFLVLSIQYCNGSQSTVVKTVELR
jgi:hypothetical protein